MKENESLAQEELPEGEAAQMLKPYGVGIDTHSKFIAVCVLIRKGDKIYRSERDFGTAWERLKVAAQWVREKLPDVPYDELDYCIESTGTYHMPVLQAFEGRPSVVNPMLAGATHRKTDVLDARMLAKQSMTNTWPRSYIPSKQGQILRVLWNQRSEAARYATRNFNRINNILLRFGHTFAASVPCRSSEGLAIIDALVRGVELNHPCIKPEALPLDVRPAIQKLLKDGEEAISETARATRYAVDIATTEKWPTEGREVEGEELVRLLQTVPGVGINTAMVWLSEVCDPRRFQNSKQVAAYCGCDPSLKVSAGKVTQHVRRKGNMKLHDALIQAATSVIARGTTPLGEWGKALAGKHSKGGFRKASGAVARRIACALWHVHRKAEAFSYEGYNFHRAKPEEPQLHEPGLNAAHTKYTLERNPKPLVPKQKQHDNDNTRTQESELPNSAGTKPKSADPGGNPKPVQRRPATRRQSSGKAPARRARKKTWRA